MLMYESSDMGSGGESDLVRSWSNSIESSQSDCSVSSANSQEFVLTFLPYSRWASKVYIFCMHFDVAKGLCIYVACPGIAMYVLLVCCVSLFSKKRITGM